MTINIKESIYIKNVGPLREVKIEEIKPLTIFIGASATGKSTLMKVIVLMRYIYKMINIRSYLKSSNISKSPFRLRFESLLHDGMQEMVSKTSEIEYIVEIHGKAYSVRYKNNTLDAKVTIPDEDLTLFKESFISESRNIIPTWHAKASANKGGMLGFYFHETLKDFNDATDAIKEVNMGFLNLRMKIEKRKNTKEYRLQSIDSDTLDFELRHASSGLQTVTPLLSVLHYFAREFSFKDAFQRSVLTYLFEQDRLSKFQPSIERSKIDNYIHIHIEEPELSLNPEAQCALMEAMLKQAFHDQADDRTLGMMIATHSPYIVNQLNVFLRASYSEKGRREYPYISEDKIAVYQVVDGSIISLMAKDNKTDQAVINTIPLSEPMAKIYDSYLNMP